jgi:ApaG protein
MPDRIRCVPQRVADARARVCPSERVTYEEIMPTPEMSEAVTEGIRVGAAAFYLPQESDPDEDRYAFGYTIVIANEGEAPAQLLRRHWVIIDAEGRRDEVRGPGVVGETPRLEPGQAFKYQSFCPLKTTWGTMEGSYTFQRDDGSTFEAAIGRFYLRLPSREPAASR